MKHTFFGVISLLLILVSCDYSTNEIFERKLDNNAIAPEIGVVELDLDAEQDTIELMFNRVYFTFSSTNQRIAFVNFYLDNKYLGRVESGNGYFDLSEQGLYVGYHKLRLEIFVNSGTGSIADHLNAEGFLFTTKEWVIKVKNTSYNNLTFSIVNGFLKLRWPEANNGPHVYVIERHGVKIGETSVCQFIDSGYIGEGSDYVVRYFEPIINNYQFYGSLTIPQDHRVEYKADKDNNFYISWEDHKYRANIDSVFIYESIHHGTYSSTTYKIKFEGDPNFLLPKSKFGLVADYRVMFKPKHANSFYTPSNYWTRFSAPTFRVALGFPSPIFDNFIRIGSSDFIYHTNKYDLGSTSYNDSIFRYSTTENKIYDRYRYNPPGYNQYWSGDHYRTPCISPDGHYFSAVAGFTYDAIFGSTSDFQDYKVFDISSLNSSYGKIPISNVGTGIIYGYDKKYIYDFINGKVLAYINSTYSMDDYNISSDGQYLFFDYYHTIDLYKFNKETSTIDKTLELNSRSTNDFFGFSALDPGQAVDWKYYTKEFRILDCSDLSVLKSFSVNEEQIIDIDYFSSRILSFSPNLLVVRSLEDGTVLYEIPVQFTYIWTNNCYLCGNSIFNKNGARYYLN